MTSPTSTTQPAPAHALPHRTVAGLRRLAHDGLADAAKVRTDGLRFASAHLAALRAAAAVLAARGPGQRGATPSVWAQLAIVAPDLRAWAEFFSARSTQRAAAEAGIPNQVTAVQAQDMVRAAGEFLAVVELALGVGVAR